MRTRNSGFSLIELLLAVILLSLFFGIFFTYVSLSRIAERQRDAIRLADLSALVVAVESYISDFGEPPDFPNVTRRSDQAFGLGFSPTNADGTGWIAADLSTYIGQLRIDPKNKNVNGKDLVYRYRHDGSRYKFDTILEANISLMENDGGSDDGHYEVGTGKDIAM